MGVFKSVDWLLGRVVGPVVAIIGLLVVLGFVVGIVARSILGIPLFGLEELILLAVVWFYMLGAILASKERTHLQADFVPVVVKNEAVIITVRIVASMISIGLSSLFIMWSHQLLQWAFARGQSTPVFSIPMYFAQASLFVAAVLMTLYLFRDLISDIQALKDYTKNTNALTQR